MKDKNLHPHRAIWIISAVVVLGALSYGTYLWNGPVTNQMNDYATTTPHSFSPSDTQSLLNSLKSTTTTATSSQQGTPPVNNKALNSLKPKGSAASSGKVNNSLLDSLKAN